MKMSAVSHCYRVSTVEVIQQELLVRSYVN